MASRMRPRVSARPEGGTGGAAPCANGWPTGGVGEAEEAGLPRPCTPCGAADAPTCPLERAEVVRRIVGIAVSVHRLLKRASPAREILSPPVHSTSPAPRGVRRHADPVGPRCELLRAYVGPEASLRGGTADRAS